MSSPVPSASGAGRYLVPARQGRSFTLPRQTCFEVRAPQGSQVADCWAFSSADAAEFMSMEHSRLHMGRIYPVPGSVFVTNRRRPILTLLADSSGGVHDTLLAACDPERYTLLGFVGRHDNCTDNLHTALKASGVRSPVTPSPLNLFENAPVAPDGCVTIVPPLIQPDGCVTLRAELDLILVISACPQDMVATNGADMTPRPIEITILA
jgi:uncharacterized protein